MQAAGRSALRRIPGVLVASLGILLTSISHEAWGAGAACPPLGPPPEGDVIINVAPEDASDLPAIVGTAASHTTILLADGYYSIPSFLRFSNPYVTLRSASGDRDAVVLDAGYSSGAAELVYVDIDHITIADLTLQRVWYHPLHVSGGGHYVTLYNLKLVDGREQFVKVNQNQGQYADFGLAACNHLELTDSGRTFIEENPTPGFLCYTGGFDLHQTWAWVVRDNVVKDIYCTNGGLAEHAIHFFKSNRDPIVERNLLLNNARGIGFGLGQSGFEREFADDPFAGTEMEGREDEVMQIGGVIQNNIIHADIGLYYDSGIGLESAWKPVVRHNTIYSEEGSFNSAIDVRFSGSESVVLANNLYHPRITLRNGAPEPEQHANVAATAEMFVDLGSGDLHLLATADAAIDQGVDTGLADDFDGQARDAAPDVGADEYLAINSKPSAVIDNPSQGAVFDSSSAIDFSGTGSDLEDGDLTSALAWSSSLDGAIGTGGNFSVVLSAGLHQITASVTDSGGLSDSHTISVGVTLADCPADVVISDEVVTATRSEKAIFSITIGPDVTIAPGANLGLTAGRTVILAAGTTVGTGAILAASVSEDACN